MLAREPGGIAGRREGVGIDNAVLSNGVDFSFVREYREGGFARVGVAEVGDLNFGEVGDVGGVEVAVLDEGLEVVGGA